MAEYDEITNKSQETPNAEEITEEKEDMKVEEDERDAQIVSLTTSLARLQADFSNYKKRTERDRKQSIELANESLIIKLLPIIDDLERAFGSLEEQTKFSEGIEMIKQNLSEILKSEGLEEISETGFFDPTLHHAVLMEENDDFEENEIIETFQKGYKLNNKVIRPAMVKVSK